MINWGRKKVSSWWDLRVSFSCKISSRKAKASAHEIVVFDFEQYSTVLLNLGHRHTIDFLRDRRAHLCVISKKEIRFFFLFKWAAKCFSHQVLQKKMFTQISLPMEWENVIVMVQKKLHWFFSSCTKIELWSLVLL